MQLLLALQAARKEARAGTIAFALAKSYRDDGETPTQLEAPALVRGGRTQGEHQRCAVEMQGEWGS